MSSYSQIVEEDVDHVISSHLALFDIELRSVARLKELISQRVQCAAVSSVGDIAGGMGHNAFHLRDVLPNAKFSVVDILAPQVARANKLFAERGLDQRFNAVEGSVYELPSAAYDLTVLWNTLFVLDDHERATASLIKATRPGGHIFMSTLLNDHDVDLHVDIVDHARVSAKAGLTIRYSTYAKDRYLELCKKHGAKTATADVFELDIDIENKFTGLGTYTRRRADGGRLQISGGILMNWHIVHITV